MNKQEQFDKKRKFQQQQQENDDDEQVEKTLHFFDSILDPYLTGQDNPNTSQIKPTNGIQQNETISNHPTTSSSSSSSSPRYIPRRFERTSHVRRYTSESNLHQIPSSEPKLPPSRLLQTTATSTEDLLTSPSNTRHSNFIQKSAHLSSNGASASLIDLSAIDQFSSRPRFRFVPHSDDDDHTLKEEPEIERQFQLKPISSNQTSFHHQIVKPMVIIPSVPKSAPINRLTETQFHHQNGNSAFKTHRASKNGVSAKIQQAKRNETLQKPTVQVALTNSDHRSALRQQQSLPQYHQSMLNLSSPQPARTNRLAPRTSYQSNEYHPSRLTIPKDPITRWIQHVNNTSSINGLVHPQQKMYPYGAYISPSMDIPPPMIKHREQRYYNPINILKPPPVQSVYLVSPSVRRNGIYPPSSSLNVYNFNENKSPRNRHSRHRDNGTITTYL